jgi:hypothetical protein
VCVEDTEQQRGWDAYRRCVRTGLKEQQIKERQQLRAAEVEATDKSSKN